MRGMHIIEVCQRERQGRRLTLNETCGGRNLNPISAALPAFFDIHVQHMGNTFEGIMPGTDIQDSTSKIRHLEDGQTFHTTAPESITCPRHALSNSNAPPLAPQS